jgi:hypothetical protein
MSPSKVLYTFILSSVRATCPAHLILFDVLILIQASLVESTNYEMKLLMFSFLSSCISITISVHFVERWFRHHAYQNNTLALFAVSDCVLLVRL